MHPKLRKGNVFIKEHACNWSLLFVQKLGIRCIQEILKNPLWWCQNLQWLYSYKRHATFLQQKHTTNVLHCYSFHGHGSVDWLGALSNLSFALSSHFFCSPRFFRLSQCCLEQWQRARAELCDSLPPSLPLSSNPFRNKQCKHISKAIHYIPAQLKNLSTGLLAERQAKRNILQAPNWGNEILLVHSLWTKPDTPSLVLSWHQHATHQTVQVIQSWTSL